MANLEKQHLLGLLTDIYGDEIAQEYHKKLLDIIKQNPIAPRQYASTQQDVILIAYPDHLTASTQPPLSTLTEFCASKLGGLINTVHILPHYPYTSDDGFAVSGYLAVKSDLGSWEDVHDLAQHFSLMFDGVFNHVSASHAWFRGFLADDPRYREFFIVLDKSTDVSLVTRPRTTPLLVGFDTAAGKKYVWATFSADQIDLNYANPEVLLEIISVLLKYVQHRADLIRLDAIAFIWKELGTNSIHRPKAHAIIQLLREVLKQAAPWVWLVTETNVPHDENITYFGNGHNEAHMVYNFALPPLVIHTLHSSDATALTDWAATLSTPSKQTTFLNFTASHDGIGVRSAQSILSEEQMSDMYERIKQRGGLLSMRTDAQGKEKVYEMNISYFNAVTDPEASPAKAINQFMCSQTVALSLAGVPAIYLHSLLGSINWPEGVKAKGENRAINRQKLDAKTVEAELQNSSSRRSQVFNHYSHLLKARRQELAFSPEANQKILSKYGSGIFALKRTSPDNQTCILALHNVTAGSLAVKLKGSWHDLISGNTYQDLLQLAPYQCVWLKKSQPGDKS